MRPETLKKCRDVEELAKTIGVTKARQRLKVGSVTWTKYRQQGGKKAHKYVRHTVAEQSVAVPQAEQMMLLRGTPAQIREVLG